MCLAVGFSGCDLLVFNFLLDSVLYGFLGEGGFIVLGGVFQFKKPEFTPRWNPFLIESELDRFDHTSLNAYPLLNKQVNLHPVGKYCQKQSVGFSALEMNIETKGRLVSFEANICESNVFRKVRLHLYIYT